MAKQTVFCLHGTSPPREGGASQMLLCVRTHISWKAVRGNGSMEVERNSAAKGRLVVLMQARQASWGSTSLCGTCLRLTVSFDHDIIDGAAVARFAQRLKKLIESSYGLPDSTIGSEYSGVEAAEKKL